MNRRRLLQAMLSVPVAGALGGCRHEHTDPHRFPPSRGGTLQVILQGPFAVVIDTKNQYRITAFVPYSDNNDHEFHYAAPIDRDNDKIFHEQDKEKRNQYQFTLEEHNLETNDRMPYIDAGFADFTLQVSGWKPSPDDYFVALDLPAPDLITYRTSDPLQLGQMVGDKLVALRTSHVLQYRIRDFNDLKKVTMRSPQLGERHPLSCADASTWIQKQGTVSTQEQGSVGETARKRMERMRAEFRCSNNPVSALFFGVGLPDSEHDTQPLVDHALTFYNKNLLGAFRNEAGIEQHRLVNAKVDVCGTGAGGNSMFVAAVQRYSMPQPRLVPVTSLTDCRASGLNAINH
jgi:hypothetical protein